VRWRIALSLSAASAAVLAGSLPATATAAATSRAATTASAGQPLYAFNTGLVLTVGARPSRGAAVRIAADTGSAGQRWVFGRHQTLRPAADRSLCLNVPGGRYRRGARLQLWTCDDHKSERFATSAPSAHTPVLFIQPAAHPNYCLDFPTSEAGDRVDLAACAGLVTQAWSRTNLDGVAGGIDNSWIVQALQPTRAGSAITAASTYTSKLNQYWMSSYTGGYEYSPALLHPVMDTALCAVLAAPEADGAALHLSSCHGRATAQLTAVSLFLNQDYTLSFITTTDGSFCVQAAASGAAKTRPIVLGRCVGNSRDFWNLGTPMITAISYQYQELYAGTNTAANSFQFSMRVTGNGASGSGVALSNDDEVAAQVWTDMVPGQSKPVANPDGSITLRPLSDESLCLTVPGADYAAGVQLTAQTCDGQGDQEFAHGLSDSPTDLVAAGDGEYCVGAPAGIAAGSAVELEPCAHQDDQTWSAFFDWYAWAGVPLAATAPVADPGDGLVISGISSAGAEVGVSPAAGTPDWYTSEDWLQVASGLGVEIQSLYDPSLCLDAPATTAGTQLTAAPCTGALAQTFSYGATSSDHGVLWELDATPTTARMCVAVGSVSGSAGLPLVLQACSASAADEAWNGPMDQL
jgi:Ricin-type beta-trefoil lectin domain